MLASSLLCASLAAPEQVHVAHAASGALWVSWLDTDAAAANGGTVTINGRTVNSQKPFKYQYQAQRGTPYTSPYVLHTRVEGLRCGEQYKYTVSSSGVGRDFRVQLPACVAGPEAGVTVGVIGDLGQTENSTQTVQHLIEAAQPSAQLQIDQVWLVGDLSYADAQAEYAAYCWEQAKGGCHAYRWDSWGKMVEPLTAQLTLQALPGNHEPEDDPVPSIGEPYVAFKSRMRGPDGGSAGGPFWYSWETGNAHFISLNSYMNFTVGSEQYRWLEADLKKVNRARTPWLFVGTHAPWYNSNKHHQNEYEETEMRKTMEPLLHKYEVDVLLCGHVHAYERVTNVLDGKVTPGAMLEFNIGDGGNREVLEDDDWLPDQPQWSVFRRNGFGHGILQTHNSTHATWTWHTILTPESTVSDSVTLIKNSFLNNDLRRGVTML